MEGIPEVAFIFDSDALVQLLISNQHGLLQRLNQEFGVMCFIMSEVEVELRSNRKFSGLIKPQLEKALRSKWLNVISSTHLEQTACLKRESPVTLAEIRELGQDYNIDIDTGEAYTFAAAVVLGVPCVSNDMSAIRTMEAKGKVLPLTILRAFDIVGFFYSEGLIDIKTAEAVRTTLRGYGEGIPACIKNQSFEDGFPSLGCRLSTSMSITASKRGWAEPFYLRRKQPVEDEGSPSD